MSSTQTKLSPIRRIAVIGAGACGLAAARALLREGGFEAIDVFEQRGDVGGVWNYTPQTAPVAIPSTDPTVIEEPVEDDHGSRNVYVSAMYESLEANIPKMLMQFPTHPFSSAHQLFPRHDQVLEYLREYAKDLRHLITFHTHVLSVVPTDPGWTVTTTATTAHYDAVIVATGHYNTPYIPSLPGLSSFPGELTHSRNFRSVAEYVGKKVLLVGNSISAIDLAEQLLPHVSSPLLQVIRSPSPSPTPAGIKVFPEISSLRVTGEVEFVDGTVESGVEVVLFATGYLYTLPFLSSLPVIDTGKRVCGTFQHVFSAANPTLAFLGLPTKIIPFPLSQSQAAWVAGVFSGRLRLPGREEMVAWEKRKKRGKKFHLFGFPEDYAYLRLLEEFVGEDEVGVGPAKWREWECWIRENSAEIKKAFNEAKKREVVARELEELGFVFENGGGKGGK